MIKTVTHSFLRGMLAFLTGSGIFSHVCTQMK